MIPLPLKYINQIPNLEIAPVGIDDKQFKINPDGSKTQKFRFTHDQTFEASTGKSINHRTLHEKLDPLFYGGCLSRTLHYIVSLRLRHPNTRILGGKSDIKSAYKRITLHGETAVRCTMMCEQYGLLSLRLTFGGSPCSNEWCIFAELCTDLANDLLHCTEWDPNLLHSPHKHRLPPPSYLDSSIPFSPAADLDVNIPNDDMGCVDDFIDDSIVIILNIGSNKERGVAAILLAIHVLCCPLDASEQILREDCLSLEKLEEEGMLSEKLIILGWEVNTRLLTIALPSKKFQVWSSDLNNLLITRKTSNRIRHMLESWKQHHPNQKQDHIIPKLILLDLDL
jgi:hypothetical protein